MIWNVPEEQEILEVSNRAAPQTLLLPNGVLNAPSIILVPAVVHTRNQTSLALIHMPDVEMWTFNNIKLEENSVKSMGVNFGVTR